MVKRTPKSAEEYAKTAGCIFPCLFFVYFWPMLSVYALIALGVVLYEFVQDCVVRKS
jgi:hypothetical protein